MTTHEDLLNNTGRQPDKAISLIKKISKCTTRLSAMLADEANFDIWNSVYLTFGIRLRNKRWQHCRKPDLTAIKIDAAKYKFLLLLNFAAIKNKMNKILITGATGHLGNAVIETLLKNIPSHQMSIITRKEEKRVAFEAKGFTAFRGDYDDVPTLEKAMNGVDTVLLISAGDEGDRMQQHKNVVNAAVKTGVACMAYTSRDLRDRTTLANKLMLDHFETEDYIRASGLTYTFFRNVLYMDVLPLFIGGKRAIENGIYQPAGEGKVAYALRSEMGEAIANVLLTETCENKIYHFTGNDAWSFYDVAAALAELSGKEVKYTDVETVVFENMMKQRGLPEPAIRKIAAFIRDIKHNQEAGISHDLEMKLGRKPTSLKDGLKLLFDL